MLRSIIHTSLIVLFGILSTQRVNAQTASVQWVHASADPLLEVVDIWVDSLKVADNLSFREATSFVSINAEAVVEVFICDSGSASPAFPLFTSEDSLVSGERYVMTLTGLLDSTAGYSPFIPLAWNAWSSVPDTSIAVGQVELYALQTVTDLSIVSLTEFRAPLGNLSNLGYGSLSSPIWVDPSHYRLRVTDQATGSVRREASLPLHDLAMADSMGMVLISGFSDPLTSDHAEVQLHLIKPSGEVVGLSATTGKVQCIHNAADPALPSIDVYVDGELVFNNIAFQAASGSFSIHSGVEHIIHITSDSASGVTEALLSDTIKVQADAKLLSVTTGAITSNLQAVQPIQHHWVPILESATNQASTAIRCFHGAIGPDSVRLYESSLLTTDLTTPLAFSTFSDYNDLPPTDYKIDLIESGLDSILHTYALNLPSYNLEGKAVVLMTSGWLDTTLFPGLEPLGLWMARNTSGKLIQLPRTVGISDIPHSSIAAYPVPADDHVLLVSKSPLGEVALYSADGRLVWQSDEISGTVKIDTQHFPSGWYVLNVVNGEQLHRKKLVIQH